VPSSVILLIPPHDALELSFLNNAGMVGSPNTHTTATEVDMPAIDSKEDGKADHLEAINDRNASAMELGETPTFGKHIQKSALRKVSDS